MFTIAIFVPCLCAAAAAIVARTKDALSVTEKNMVPDALKAVARGLRGFSLRGMPVNINIILLFLYCLFQKIIYKIGLRLFFVKCTKKLKS